VVGNRSFDTTNTTSNPLKFAFRRRNICLSAISRSCCISVDTAQSSVLIVGNFVPLMSVPSLPQAVDLRPQLVNRPGGQQAQSIPETTQALCDDPLRRRVSAALLAAELRFYALGQVGGGHCEGAWLRISFGVNPARESKLLQRRIRPARRRQIRQARRA